MRDIESCLASNQAKLYHMGLGGVPARSTLSDALNQRDWRIYHDLAMRLIIRVVSALWLSRFQRTQKARIDFLATGYAESLR